MSVLLSVHVFLINGRIRAFFGTGVAHPHAIYSVFFCYCLIKPGLSPMEIGFQFITLHHRGQGYENLAKQELQPDFV